MAYMGRLRPKSVPFPGFRYNQVGISSVEVYERVGKSVILVCKGVKKSQQAHFMDVKGCESQMSIFMEIALYVSIIIIIIITITIIISSSG